MPPKKIQPMAIERPLEGMPDNLVSPPPPPSTRRLEAANAFSRLATPEYWGLDLAHYADITPQMIAAADPDNFRKDLIGTPPGKGFAVGYWPYHEPYTRVALTPAEYSMIPRNPECMGKAAVGAFLAKEIDEVPSMERRGKAVRSSRHQLEAKVEAMESYLGTLDADTAMLARLIEAARYHWYARGKEISLRADAQWIRSHVFGNMFATLREQRSWTPEKEDLAKRSLDMRLFFIRANNGHTLEWGKLFTVNLEHTDYKIGLFKDRIHRTTQVIKKSKE